MPGPHPTDRNLAALVDGRLNADQAAHVRDHVQACQRCQLRLGLAAGEGLPVAVPSGGAVGVPVVEESSSDMPAQGDIWRLSWETTTVLAVIWVVGADRVSVLPVADTADADDWTAVLDRTSTSGLGNLAVSVALETAVPWAVLDARVGDIRDIESLRSLRAAFRAGLTTDTPRGDPVRSALDDRLVGLGELAELLMELANAVWAPVVTATQAGTPSFDELADAGIAVNRALAISRGTTPTDDEADLIEAATGTRPGSRPVDEQLRRAIDRPRRKAAIRARARANRRSEAAERLSLARDAQPELAAARGTQGAPPDYDLILDRLLDA
ncbi:MAG: hypothetical protein ACOYXM_17850 [Actinomycetota bacterium]